MVKQTQGVSIRPSVFKFLIKSSSGLLRVSYSLLDSKVICDDGVSSG